ncbi:MAG: hypothetical protein EPN26_03470 [Rhodospirillales bacterium]|nr:MAG: hypothetical protein EPN26_03470 [Rhodospirillales bacterium]
MTKFFLISIVILVGALLWRFGMLHWYGFDPFSGEDLDFFLNGLDAYWNGRAGLTQTFRSFALLLAAGPLAIGLCSIWLWRREELPEFRGRLPKGAVFGPVRFLGGFLGVMARLAKGLLLTPLLGFLRLLMSLMPRVQIAMPTVRLEITPAGSTSQIPVPQAPGGPPALGSRSGGNPSAVEAEGRTARAGSAEPTSRGSLGAENSAAREIPSIKPKKRIGFDDDAPALFAPLEDPSRDQGSRGLLPQSGSLASGGGERRLSDPMSNSRPATEGGIEPLEGGEESSDSPLFILAQVQSFLTDRGWDVRRDILVDGGQAFVADSFDDDPQALIPMLAVSEQEVRPIFPMALGGLTWLADPWSPDRAGIGEWEAIESRRMSDPVYISLRARSRLYDTHRATLEALGHPASSIQLMRPVVVLAGGNVEPRNEDDDLEQSWDDAGVDVVLLEIEGSLDFAFGGEAADRPYPLVARQIQELSNKLKKKGGK